MGHDSDMQLSKSVLVDFLRLCMLRSTCLWWSRSGSNRRPPPCKGGVLPAELLPQISSRAVSPFVSSFARIKEQNLTQFSSRSTTEEQIYRFRLSRVKSFLTLFLVGLVGVEPTASSLSGTRSSQLSYRPMMSKCKMKNVHCFVMLFASLQSLG